MTPDNLLHALALCELVQREGGNTCDIDDAVTLLGGEMCQHAAVALYWAGAFVNLAQDVKFDLTTFIASERAAALGHHDEHPGMA